jgi:hypothetical protein
MNILQEYTIYSDLTHKWFFLIPTQADLPAGDYTIISLIGRERQVDLEALEPFAVPRELAEAYLSGQMRHGLERVTESVMSFLRTVRDSRPRAERPDPQETRWNIDLLAELFDQPPEAVRREPEATRQGVQELFAAGVSFFGRVKSGDEEELAIARQQVTNLADLLRRYGVQVDEAISELPDKLATVYANTPGDKLT